VRSLKYTKQFKKDLRRAKRDSRKDVDKLQLVVDLLRENGELSSEYFPHPLIGNWLPHWECHIQPDFLLIYTVNDDMLKLARCGSHSELF